MKKNGFTLIEIVIVLSILSCILCASALSYKFIKNIENEQNVVMSIRNIDDMLTSARLYCLKNNQEGTILIEPKADKYLFYLNKTGYAKPIRVEKLMGNVHFYCTSEQVQWEIKINNQGVPTAGTIVLIDNNKKCYKIAIGVGNPDEKIH